ncbi:MAG: mercury resistance system transport protein MerF, partial [Alphaproteobacteria bacterium]
MNEAETEREKGTGKDKADRLLVIGAIGTIVAALCCFTPVLVGLLGVVGLAALTGYLDIVLLPALGFFLLLTAYALWRRQRTVGDDRGEGGR